MMLGAGQGSIEHLPRPFAVSARVAGLDDTDGAGDAEAAVPVLIAVQVLLVAGRYAPTLVQEAQSTSLLVADVGGGYAAGIPTIVTAAAAGSGTVARSAAGWRCARSWPRA
jgi:hypothetical protein